MIVSGGSALLTPPAPHTAHTVQDWSNRSKVFQSSVVFSVRETATP